MNILFYFLLGGFLVLGTKQLTYVFDEKIGSYFWTFPFTLIPILYYMKDSGKTKFHIQQFIQNSSYASVLLGAVLFVLSQFYIYYDLNLSLFLGFCVWIVLTFILYYIS